MQGRGSNSGRRRSGPRLGRLVVEDLRRTRFQRDFVRELRELYDFYLDEADRARLAGMGRLRRSVWIFGWLLKSLLLKLSPARRLLLVVALLLVVLGNTRFTFSDWSLSADLRPWGCLVLLVILMLELKDKLLAKDEIQIARQVQIALLPREHPRVPGWSVWSCSRPANDVGGDLVDYLVLDEFRHGILLGDVAGKGLGAALLTAKLQATLRAIVADAASLDDLAARVNAIFFRDGLDNRYATLFYVELQHDSGQLRYLNAGHNPAYLMRDGGLDKLGASSYPLGMLPGANYEERALDLQPGEVVVAYSDGLTEACNARGEEFGEQRIEALLRESGERTPQRIGARILEAVDGFLGEARPHDDLSLLVIARSSR